MHECEQCVCENLVMEYAKINCPCKGEERRLGSRTLKGIRFLLCCGLKDAKTTKLFKNKLEILSYSIPAILTIKDEVKNIAQNEEHEKYSKIVHNLKTLNAQSLLSQYKFISQESFSNNYGNLFEVVLHEVKNRPKDAAVAILKQAKNNEHMKTEFSTHEKLSVENPYLFMQFHIIRKVILNVYHSFDDDFREKKVIFKISESDKRAKFDYETIRVAIYHIFSNAIKYIANNSTLHVHIKENEDYIEVDFCMRSFFIYPDEIETIFADHVSGKVAQNKKLSGNGLGMGLIKRALSINGCKICIIPGEKKIINNTEFGDNIFRFMFPVR